jgi:quinolinate synthase
MNETTLEHVYLTLKSIKENKISELSEIKVDENTRYWAKIALERMFEI